jgi:hypothetical protein
MILTLVYSSPFFGISFVKKDCDSVVIIQSKEKPKRSSCLYVKSIYLYAITITYYFIVRYKNIDNISTVKVIGLYLGSGQTIQYTFQQLHDECS